LSAAVWLSNFFFPLTFTFDSVGTNFQKFVAYSRKSRRDLAADCGLKSLALCPGTTRTAAQMEHRGAHRRRAWPWRARLPLLSACLV